MTEFIAFWAALVLIALLLAFTAGFMVAMTLRIPGGFAVGVAVGLWRRGVPRRKRARRRALGAADTIPDLDGVVVAAVDGRGGSRVGEW